MVTESSAFVPFVDFGLEDALIHAAVFVPLGVLVPLLTARPRRWKAVAIVLATRSTAVAGFVERFRWPARERPRSQPVGIPKPGRGRVNQGEA
ncbi:hypothetical protein B2G67_03570 [Microbacterium foliorum]|nr:hypothetical protein B2G67_03570 [Microbacterium foliorum]